MISPWSRACQSRPDIFKYHPLQNKGFSAKVSARCQYLIRKRRCTISQLRERLERRVQNSVTEDVTAHAGTRYCWSHNWQHLANLSVRTGVEFGIPRHAFFPLAFEHLLLIRKRKCAHLGKIQYSRKVRFHRNHIKTTWEPLLYVTEEITVTESRRHRDQTWLTWTHVLKQSTARHRF